MNPLRGLSGAWRWAVRKTLGLWVKATIKPDDIAGTLAARGRPVCYVLETESRADFAVLDIACTKLQMPRPDRCFALARQGSLWSSRSRSRAPRYLVQMVDAAAADPDFDADLVPVSIFWGRAPHKEQSLWRLLFAENWVLVGRFRKMLNVLVNGRNTVVYFGEPVALREALQGLPPPRAVRRVMQARRELAEAARGRGRAGLRRRARRRAVLLTARQYAMEIAANYSQPFITFMASLLKRLWTWLYDGVEFEHVEKLQEIGDGAEIIYVPCHRSHMDYLLLSYVIYLKGFAVPHVAAGANLNLPVIGRFLRKGGAFFLRRSFKGHPLYAAVFTKYLGFMMERGHPLEYFVEGGRSRTGRLLVPRTGMLSMTVRSYLREPKRPVVFMPVYFGYERIVEGRTYIGELSGRPKEKESVIGVIRSLPALLRSKFGKVHVNLGEPIVLDDLLDAYNPGWRGTPSGTPGGAGDDASPPGWIAELINDLAFRVVSGINSAAAVTPVNLVSMAVLAMPRQALLEADLKRQLDLYQRLLRDAPYAPLVTVTTMSAEQMIRYAESMGMLERQAHPLGDIMRMTAERAVLATYYRNNILHLFAMPSLIACCFVSNARMRTEDIKRLAWRVYPYIRAELALRWPEEEIGAVTDSLLDALTRSGLLQPNEDRSEWRRPAPTSLEAIQLSLLAETTIQTLERYYLVIAVLLRAGSGNITHEALEERCHLMAQRISILYGLDSPEFFDKSLFRNFIELLGRRQVVTTAQDGSLVFGEPLLGVAADAQLVLSEQLRHDILQATLGQ